MAVPVGQFVDFLENEHEKWERIRAGIKSTDLRLAIEEVLEHTEREISRDLVVTVFRYDDRVDDLIPLACKGLVFDDWVIEASGKHRHGFIRSIFDNAHGVLSRDIQSEPSAVNRGLLIKYNLGGYYGAPLVDAAFKFGIISFMSHGPRLFGEIEVAKFIKVGHLVTELLATAHAEERAE